MGGASGPYGVLASGVRADEVRGMMLGVAGVLKMVGVAAVAVVLGMVLVAAAAVVLGMVVG